jgi:hypothetical protein
MNNIPKLVTKKIIVPIDRLSPNRWNPNKMSIGIYNVMKQAIVERGLWGSIYVRKLNGQNEVDDKYEILDGEHRWKACKELGWTELPVECSINEVRDIDVPYYTVYFNNTKGKDDIEKRAQVFEQLQEGQEQLLPFTKEEIENEKQLFKFDFSQYETKDSELSQNEFNHVLSFKFNNDEWEIIQKAFKFSKKDNQTEKQLFMVLIGRYLDLKEFKENQK